MHKFIKFILGMKFYLFQTVPLSIIRSFSLYKQQWYMPYRLVPSWSCSQAVSKLVWHIPLLSVQWKTADDGQRNCPKHATAVSSWSRSQAVSKSCMTYTIAVCTVKNCRWWTEELSETYKCSFVLILLASCQQTCMTYTIGVCTVKNSWWWTEELSETCRILFQK